MAKYNLLTYLVINDVSVKSHLGNYPKLLKEYEEVFKDHLLKGAIVEVNTNSIPVETLYLPNHDVINGNHSPTRLTR